jgi:hypothetical protein
MKHLVVLRLACILMDLPTHGAARPEETCRIDAEQRGLDPDVDGAVQRPDERPGGALDRTRRARKYDTPGARSLAPAGPATPETLYVDEAGPAEALPVEESQTIVVGTIASFQPYLSNDRTFIFTDVRVCVDEFLKAEGAPTPMLTFERAGGVLVLSDGQRLVVSGAGAIRGTRVGRRYVLFLGRQPSTDIYSLLQAYDVTDGRARGMERAGIASSVEGLQADVLLERIRTALRHSPHEK